MLISANLQIPYFPRTPEALSSNTFHFEKPGTSATAAELLEVVTLIFNFYTAIDQLLSPVCVNPCRLRAYDLASPLPRAPIIDSNISLTFATGGVGLPEENAIVLSYQGTRVSGIPQARRRGRLYLGPLSNTVLAFGTSSTMAQITAATRTTIGAAAEALRVATSVWDWVVWSPTNGTTALVQGGWVDDSMDTQRRRGQNAGARTTWGNLV